MQKLDQQPPAPPSPAPDTGQSSGRGLRIALALSVALNLAIAGVVVGAFARNGGPMMHGAPVREVGFGPFTEALSKEDRYELRRAFLAQLPDFRQTRQAMRQDLDELLIQLRADPFDPEALRAAIDRQSRRNAQRLETGQALIFDLLVKMDADARLAFADRLEKSLSRGPRIRSDAPPPQE